MSRWFRDLLEGAGIALVIAAVIAFLCVLITGKLGESIQLLF